ncbi:hypothetical protein [Nonomuraea sp. NPDC002799]
MRRVCGRAGVRAPVGEAGRPATFEEAGDHVQGTAGVAGGGEVGYLQDVADQEPGGQAIADHPGDVENAAPATLRTPA